MSDRINMQPRWHPDFRIQSTLPDTRAIHTNFIIKIVLFTCVLIVTAIVLQREYQAYLLRQRIDNLEAQVQGANSGNQSRLEKSERFRELALSVKELQLFFKAPFVAYEPIIELASIKSEELTFTRLVLSESVIQTGSGKKSKSQLVFNLKVAGDVQDLPVLTQFKRKLEESLLLNPSGYQVSIDEDIQQRDVDTGIIPFKLSISLTPSKKAPTKKGTAK